MARFAVINGNKVINHIVAETKENAETATQALCIEVTDEIFDIGWDYIDGVFIEPTELGLNNVQ